MTARTFPNGPQDAFYNIESPFLQGMQYAVDPQRDEIVSGLIRNVTEVAQQSTVTITDGADGDVFGVVIDGLAITTTALTSATIDGDRLKTAIDAYIATYGTALIASCASAVGVVTIVFGDYVPHTVTALDSGTTSSVIATSVASASYARLSYGVGVTLDTGAGFDLTGPSLRCIRGATGGSDVLAGVIAYDTGTQMSPYEIEALGFDPAYLAPINPYRVIRKGYVVVPWVGTLPTGPTSAVYWINAPATLSHKNKFRSDVNGGEADLVSAFVEGVLPDHNLVMVRFDL